MIGSSRETVTRLLSDLRKKQLIRLEGSTLVIRNRTALEALVSCPPSGASAAAGKTALAALRPSLFDLALEVEPQLGGHRSRRHDSAFR